MQPDDDGKGGRGAPKAERGSYGQGDAPAQDRGDFGGAPAMNGSSDSGNGGGGNGGNGGNGEGGEGGREGNGLRRMQRRGRRRGRNGKQGGKREGQEGSPKAAFVPNPEPGMSVDGQGGHGGEQGQPQGDFGQGQNQGQGQGQAPRKERTPRVARGPGARGGRNNRNNRDNRDNRSANNENRGNEQAPRPGKPPRGQGGQGEKREPRAQGEKREPRGDAQPGNAGGGEDHKLQKLLAEAGLGSRRDMEEAITAGRVSVNGKTATLGQRITRRDVVRYDGKQVKIKTGREAAEVIIYHKPPGEIVSHDDPEGRPSVFDKVPAPKAGGKWIAVGRLDFNTEGLLILTTSGDLANKLMHPRYEVEREYSVRVIGELTDDQMDQLLDGVDIGDGPARFLKLEEGHFSDETPGINRWYDVMIREGRNREVRRMFEAVGVTVSRLIRTRFGPISLPRALRRGQMRPLTVLETKDLAKGTSVAKPTSSDPLAGLPQDPDDLDDLPEINGNVAPPSETQPRSRGVGGNKGGAGGNKGGKGKRGGQPMYGEANGNFGNAGGRGAAAKGRGKGARGAAGGAATARGKARPAGKGGRGKGRIDPNSMTLDGRRVVKRRRDDDMPAPKPVHTPVIIHRRSKLKVVPEGGEGGES